MTARRHKSHGFTLLELSIVLIILGVITGMGMVSTLGMLESAKLVATQKRMDEIEKALLSFRQNNNRLPCPSDQVRAKNSGLFGYEANASYNLTSVGSTTLNCAGSAPSTNFYTTIGSSTSVVEGGVPVLTLGLPIDYVYDGWGRRFAYAVDAYMTLPSAFVQSRPNDQCNINVINSAGGARSTGAVYVLMSYGPNGHGGFINGTTRVNAGSTNAAELANCHCNSSAVTQGTIISGIASWSVAATSYTQADSTEAVGGTTGFDDIVRYKERWELQNYDDQNNFTYVGPQVAAAFNAGIELFTYQCGHLRPVSGSPLAGDANSRLAFAPNNADIFSYNTGTHVCSMFPINGSAVGLSTLSSPLEVNAVTGTADCPGNGTMMVMSNNGYLAIVESGSPYIQVWKFSPTDNRFFLLNAPGYTQLTLAYQPTSVAISGDGMYLATANAANTFTIYQLVDNNRYVAFGTAPLKHLTQPAGPATETGLAFSKDGRFLAVTAGTNISVYPIDKRGNFGTVVTLSATLGSSAAPSALQFTPDNQFLIVSAATYTSVYSFNTATAVLTQMSTAASQITGLAVSPDSRFYGTLSQGGGVSSTVIVNRFSGLNGTNFWNPYTYAQTDATLAGATATSIAMYH